MEKTNIIANTFRQTNLWAGIVPMQFLAIWALWNVFTGQAPDWWWITTLIGYVCLTMIGISAGYHRLFCHKGFKVNRVVKLIMLWFGMIAGQGSPIFWIGIHRGYHHRYADGPGDAHSPRDGFWHSYILWMFKRETMSLRSIPDLLRDPDMVFAHRHYTKILWGTHLAIALISINLWLYLLLLPAFITLHCFLLQTCLAHYRFLGYRNFEVKDNSVNIPWLFPLILGECWHNNHHGHSRCPNYQHQWWELDPTYWIIKLIKLKN
jgi:stearoyl-CoA desaturase (delta-9 desaturase)